MIGREDKRTNNRTMLPALKTMQQICRYIVKNKVCNVLHDWSRGQKNKQQNNAPSPKNNAAAGNYQGPLKIELLKGEGLLKIKRDIWRKIRQQKEGVKRVTLGPKDFI